MLQLLRSQFTAPFKTAPTRDVIVSQMLIVLNLTSRSVTSNNSFNDYPPSWVMLPKSFIPIQLSEKNVNVFVMRTTYVYLAPFKLLIMFGEQYEI